jgi:hypothetical protein
MIRNVATRGAWGLAIAVITAPGAALAQAGAPAAKPAAQPSATRVYKTNIADEDWSFLADRTQRQDFFDPIKYISFMGGRSYLTLGGEVRIRPEGLRLRGAPGEENTVDNYVFQRYLFATDWHLGKRFRLYGELQSGLLNGKLASPRPTDENVADVHQAFFEYHSPRPSASLRPGGGQFLLRVGRQEMTIGSSRLISASQGLNVKRSFDGVVGGYRRGAWQVEAGTARLVAVGGGAFDDSSRPDQEFWGASVLRTNIGLQGGAVSGYYLGVDREQSLYTQGLGAERRHTVGGKFLVNRRTFEFSVDAIGQWGEFAGAPARAWAAALEQSIRAPDWPLRPRFMVRFNSATGDRDPADPRLESFNPLFPGSSYSGLVGLLGPTNLTDVTPGVQLLLPHRMVFVFESPSYFRSSVRDGIYNIQLRPLPVTAVSPARYVGTNPALVVVWNTTRHLSLTGVITRFLPGAFLEGSFAEHGFGFYSTSFTYRF